MPIHPTAVVDRQAEIHPTAEIGPYVVIDGPVRVGRLTCIHPFVHVHGFTEIGAECRIHSGAVLGDLPQDWAYRGGESSCRIGDGTIIREGVTIHRGTSPGSATIVGKGCFLMANAHVGHDCQLEDEVILVNGALLGGYVQVGRRAFISGNVAVHQFVRVGELAMIGGLTKLTQDVPPFFMADGDGSCVGVNSVGLRRAGFTAEQRLDVQQAYRLLYRSKANLRQAVGELERAATTDAGRRIVAFLREPSRRGITGGKNRDFRQNRVNMN